MGTLVSSVGNSSLLLAPKEGYSTKHNEQKLSHMVTIEGLASSAAVVLSFILVWAALSKLRNPATTAKEFQQLGLPDSSVRLVPLAEIGVALALLVLPGWGSVFAFFLLAAFTSILVSILRSGSEQSCSCFGQASKGPVTAFDLLRNAVLLVFSILGSTIDRLGVPQPLDIVIIGLVTATLLSYILISNRAQSDTDVANSSHGGYKG